MILRHSHEQEAGRKFLILRAHAFFRDWPDGELHEAVKFTRLRSYTPDSIVFDGFHSHPSESVCLLVSGTCRLVRRVPVREAAGRVVAVSSRPCLGLAQLESEPSLAHLQVQPRHLLMTTASAQPGAMFGAWTQGTAAVCACKCTCLLLSKVIFMRHDHGKCLDLIRSSVPMLFLDDRFLFTAYKQQCVWERFRKQVMESAVAQRDARRHNHPLR
jgi:hypothetical protein